MLQRVSQQSARVQQLRRMQQQIQLVVLMEVILQMTGQAACWEEHSVRLHK
jgi:hypothetical protein